MLNARPGPGRRTAQAVRLVKHVPTADLIAELLGRYPAENQVRAVLDVANAAEVGVSWEDRETVQSTLEVTFTDEEWAKVALQLQDWDEDLFGHDWAGYRPDALRGAVDKAGVDLAVVEARDEDLEACASQCTCPPEAPIPAPTATNEEQL